MTSVYIALGSNIDAERNLADASIMLREHFPDIRFSGVYQTTPTEYVNQPDFLNAVARIETEKEALEVYTILRDIEERLGKALAFRFGPRTIDLDLLLYGDLIAPHKEEWLRSQANFPPGLVIIPHPRMHLRRFVLEPLCELIDPGSTHPVLGKTWEELRDQARGQGQGVEAHLPKSLDLPISKDNPLS